MKQYYIISLKHTSKGDTALTFWCANGGGYTYSRNRAGKYTEEEAKKCILGSIDNVMVECEKVDPFWMNAVDYNDKFVAVANTPVVRKAIGITDQHMKPKKWATCKMAFMNTPVAPVIAMLFMIFLFACSPSRMITPCPQYVGIVIDTIRPRTIPVSWIDIDTTVKRDTVPEWMYTSTTRAKSFVFAHKALSVRVNGFCVEHLHCDGKPLKWPYMVGWCEGKEAFINRLASQLK